MRPEEFPRRGQRELCRSRKHLNCGWNDLNFAISICTCFVSVQNVCGYFWWSFCLQNPEQYFCPKRHMVTHIVANFRRLRRRRSWIHVIARCCWWCGSPFTVLTSRSNMVSWKGLAQRIIEPSNGGLFEPALYSRGWVWGSGFVKGFRFWCWKKICWTWCFTDWHRKTKGKKIICTFFWDLLDTKEIYLIYMTYLANFC